MKIFLTSCSRIPPHVRIILSLALVAAVSKTLIFGQQPSVPDLVEEIKPSVVLIVTSTDSRRGKMIGQGSGFFVRSDQIVTNWHVVNGAKAIAIKTSEGEIYAVKTILATDKVHDLAILQLEQAVANASTLEVSGSLPREGERVVVVGNPKGLGWSVSDGLVASVRDMRETTRLIQITAPISSGSSGSPVVNMKGEVVGIAVGTRVGGQNLNFAISSQHVVNLIRNNESDIGVISSPRQTQITSTPTVVGIDESRKPASPAAVKMSREFYEQGVSLAAKRDWKGALTLFEKSVVVNPIFAEAWFYSAYSKSQLGRNSGAIEDYKEALRVKPYMHDAYWNLGLIYYNLKLFKEAAASFERATNLRPDQAEGYFNLGLSYLHSNDLSEAITSFKEVVRLRPDDANAYYQLGQAYYYANRYHDAAEALRRTLLFAPDHSRAAYFWGITYLAQKNYADAIEKLTLSIGMRADSSEAYSALGDAYYFNGQYDNAVSQYKKAIELNDRNIEPYQGLSNILIKQGKKDESVRLFRDLVNKYPDHSGALVMLGAALIQVGDNAEAQRILSKASEIEPKSADAKMIIGYNYQEIGQYEKAAGEYSEAIRLEPNDSRHYSARGWNYLYMRQGTGAINDSLKFLALDGWKVEHSQYMVIVAHFGFRLMNQPQAAAKTLADCALKCDTSVWPYPVLRFLRGELTESALISLANDNDKMTEARGYVGMSQSLSGQWRDALQHFNWVIQNGNKDFTEHTLAVSESRYIEAAVKRGETPKPTAPSARPRRPYRSKTH